MATVNTVSYEEKLVADLQIKSLDGTYEIAIEEVVVGDFAAGKETMPPSKQNRSFKEPALHKFGRKS